MQSSDRKATIDMNGRELNQGVSERGKLEAKGSGP